MKRRRHCSALPRRSPRAVGGATLVARRRPAGAQMPVFDATNYAQNLLQAARALDQINNQVKSLQNEAPMLQNMATQSQDDSTSRSSSGSRSAMQQIDQLMGQAEGIQFKVAGLDQQVKALFPGALGQALTGDQRVAAGAGAARCRDRRPTARRWASRRRSPRMSRPTPATLGELAASSQGAVGALQVGQAANQLMALSVKQQLQLQNLMASEYRASGDRPGAPRAGRRGWRAQRPAPLPRRERASRGN